MSTVTIALPDPLDAGRAERVKSSGARSKEEYLLGLVESDCAAGELERVLAERRGGPFAPLEPDWERPRYLRRAAPKNTTVILSGVPCGRRRDGTQSKDLSLFAGGGGGRMLRSFCRRIARPPTTTFAPAASERSFDCAAQSLRSAQDDRGARARVRRRIAAGSRAARKTPFRS